MCGVRPRGWERAISYCAPEEAEAPKGKSGQMQNPPSQEGSRGAHCPRGVREFGETSAPRGKVKLFRGRERRSWSCWAVSLFK